MARSTTIRIYYEWEQEDPDGSDCSVCGDQCLLSMWRLFASSDAIAGKIATSVVLCGSCMD